MEPPNSWPVEGPRWRHEVFVGSSVGRHPALEDRWRARAGRFLTLDKVRFKRGIFVAARSCLRRSLMGA